MAARTRKRRLVLWGSTGAGKTTLLAATVARAERPPLRLDPERPSAWLEAEVERLGAGRPALPTRDPVREVELLPEGEGPRLRVSDLGAGLGDGLPDDAGLELLAEADAVILVLDAAPRGLEERLEWLHAAARVAVGRPGCVAVTKLEGALPSASPAWDAEGPWWQEHAGLARVHPALATLPFPVVPTSAFGYLAGDGRPAALVDEFGELLPYAVAPRGVRDPFVSVLEAL